MKLDAFAELIGVNRNTYQSMELGRMGISPSKITQLFLATGVSPRSLDASYSRIPLTFIDEKPYTKSFFKNWLKSPKTRKSKEMTADVAFWIEILFEAAQNKNCHLQIFIELVNTLTEIRSKFGLGAETERILKKLAPKYSLKYLVGALRRNPDIAKDVGFKDSPDFKDEDLWDFIPDMSKSRWLPNWGAPDNPSNPRILA